MARRVRAVAFFAAVFTRRLTCAVLRLAADFERDTAAFARVEADLRRLLRFGFAPSPIIPPSLSKFRQRLIWPSP